jgi:glycosyltransferase involved in cell wall biosynthesis
MAAATDPRVFVVLSLFRPDEELLDRQVRSLVGQSHRGIEVLACADGPLEGKAATLLAGIGDSRIRLVAFDRNVGVHANFARGLREALARSDRETDLFAFCDQDDFWHPTKLEQQVACLGDPDVSLCHSDARVVARDGRELAPSLFDYESRSRSATLTDLLVMNSVTGMTAAFRRDVARAASGFPLARSRYVLHDHWTALVASLFGRIHLIDKPLVDYVQHDDSVLGARSWGRGAGDRRLCADRRYLLRCYRQYLWRRDAYGALRKAFADTPDVAARIGVAPVKRLFDCGASRYAGLALSLRYLMRGERRQADQVWRLERGKMLDCRRRERMASRRGRSEEHYGSGS